MTEPKPEHEIKMDYDLSSFYDAVEANLDIHNPDNLCTELIDMEERYSGEELIGEGGMKRVYRVHDGATGHPVAMAVPRDLDDVRVHDRLIREARLTAMLQHPNITTVLDIGVRADGRPFFTMELKVGDSLEHILKDQNRGQPEDCERYSRERLLDIFLKICDAVAYAHANGIVHLDLKPANIQIGRYGEVVVCDWGLSKVLSAEVLNDHALILDADLLNDFARDEQIRGTPGYMAPEQASAGTTSTHTDVYGLGAILYAILIGHAPIKGSDDTEYLHNTTHGQISIPSELSRKIPAALTAVCLKALAKDPADRYQSVQELQAEIVRYQGGYATRAEDAGFLQQLRLLIARNQRICTLLAIFVVTFSSVLSVMVVRLQQSNTELAQKRDHLVQALSKAETERHRAERAEKEAIQAHKKTIQAQQEVTRYLEVMHYKDLADRYLFDASLRRLDEDLKRNPRQEHLLFKAQLMVVLQRFDEAVELLSKVPESESHELRKIAKKYVALKVQDSVPGGLTASLLKELWKWHIQTAKQAYIHAIRQADWPQIEITQAIVECLNPEASFQMRATELADGIRLEISGDSVDFWFKQVGIPQRNELLKLLPIRELDISKLRCLPDLSGIEGLRVLKLGPIHKPGIYVRSRMNLESLQEVIIHPAHEKLSGKLKLPKRIKVVVEE